MSTTETSRWHRWVLWLPGLLVALAAGAATAHGLYEVALGARVPAAIAWLYPVITDGLALVAYVSTIRLRARDRAYAWCVVVLAAGLSGLAQATYLADGLGSTAPAIRFGVGAWPAVAAAIVAHLLFLLGRVDEDSADDHHASSETPVRTVEAARASTAVPSTRAEIAGPSKAPGEITVQPPPPPTVSNDRPAPGVQVSTGAVVQSGAASTQVPSNPPAARGASGARDRARAAARRHAAHHGDLPSVRELERLAEVSRGSAHAALKELREHPSHLHIVNADQEAAQP